jgi:circadian clock protein KaiB
VRFWLFVNAKSPNARHAIAELAELRRRHLPDAYIEIIDINERPDLAERERLLGSPTLIRTTPRPVRRIVGDLSDHDRVLHALELDAARGTPA